jgi:hypothetical protein
VDLKDSRVHKVLLVFRVLLVFKVRWVFREFKDSLVFRESRVM